MIEETPVAAVRWSPAFRIVPTRFPTVSLFDRVANPEDFEALYALEAMTNDRLREELGEISMVPANERIYGTGSTPIMAAFTHLNPCGSRFSDGSYGVFYAACNRKTAIEETRYHHGRFLAATKEAPQHLQMRLYTVRIAGELHDVRSTAHPEVHSPSSYAVSQALGRKLRATGSEGIVYRSVRWVEGQCAALFKPRCASRCLHAAHLSYVWDGKGIAAVLEAIE